MAQAINYLLPVAGREIAPYLDPPLPEAILTTLDTGRCITIEYGMRNTSLVSNVDLSPVAALLELHLTWGSVFVADRKNPLDAQWQQERRREVGEFETFLRRLSPQAPIMAVSDSIVSEWGALISQAEGLDALFDQQDIGLRPDGLWYPGYTYYDWLCERKYVEMFFAWVEKTYPRESPEQPERWKGWAWLEPYPD